MLKKANLKMQLKATRTAHVTRATIGPYQRPQTSLFCIDTLLADDILEGKTIALLWGCLQVPPTRRRPKSS